MPPPTPSRTDPKHSTPEQPAGVAPELLVSESPRRLLAPFGPHDPEHRLALGPGEEWEENAVGRRIDGDGVARVGGMLAVDGDESRLAEIEHLEIAAFRRDVEPTKTWIDREDVG